MEVWIVDERPILPNNIGLDPKYRFSMCFDSKEKVLDAFRNIAKEYLEQGYTKYEIYNSMGDTSIILRLKNQWMRHWDTYTANKTTIQ